MPVRGLLSECSFDCVMFESAQEVVDYKSWHVCLIANALFLAQSLQQAFFEGLLP